MISSGHYIQTSGIQLSELSFYQILLSKCEIRHVKSMACNNRVLKHGNNLLYALGYQNGKIVLNSFDPSSTSASKESTLIGKEFIQEYSRSCNALDFCQIDNHLLASGFDRCRNDFSVMVWDIAHTGINYNQASQSATISGTTKPLHRFAQNEQVHSLRWFQDRFLVCGMNNKQIKLLDIRDYKNQPPYSYTKGVYGICQDLHSEYRFASFYENFIYVWDLRSFEDPLITIGPEPSSFIKIEWCPTRSNILAGLLKDTNSIRLYDYKHYTNLNDLPEPSILKRDITPFESNNPQIISSFSWHPSNEFQMTAITSNGAIRDFKVVDRITLNWSPISEIIWTHGKRILQCIDSTDNIYKEIDDIAFRMRKLAIEGYGLSIEKLWQLFRKDNPLHFVWKWVTTRIESADSMKVRFGAKQSIDKAHDIFAANSREKFAGIVEILCRKDSGGKELQHSGETVYNLPKSLRRKKIYTSLGRAKALQFCGWSSRYFFHERSSVSGYGFDLKSSTFDENMPCDYFIKLNQIENNFTRIAAILIFNGKIEEAINFLNQASDFVSNKSPQSINNLQQSSMIKLNELNCFKQTEKAVSLNAIALALSALSTSNDIPKESSIQTNGSVWTEICSKLKSKLDDPYIRAIFNFICDDFATETNAYADILNDEKLDIADRIAFGCLYLPDNELLNYVNRLRNNYLNKIDLRAILFTGLSDDIFELFCKYVENTSDVQTISLIVLWTLPNEISKKSLVKTWIDTYKQLLDCWRLWNVRAQFDLRWFESLNHSEEPRQQIFIVCNYCRSPISAYSTSNEPTTSSNVPSSNKSPLSHPSTMHPYNRATTSSSSSSRMRICSCSNCGKTLPRCSLCLTQLGTPAGTYWRPGLMADKSSRKQSPFSALFTWCQTCRHGGHSIHLLEWFMENNYCPVAGCKCKCMCLDANARPTFNTNI
ncbi:hypothetical protein QR98_0008830 [Sarcoptes scabiei]|uniref:Uncharacterized protein n=1 Tax=Sarcoptes scabiei TaxID=52283 RepID=A0A131ZVF4_SARSC|nr:hypothetical protein QR98_0008830 [Sarcoptes scabiei]